MINRNMRNHNDELVKHLNCQAKESAIEGSDLKYRKMQEMSGKRRGSQTHYNC